MERCFVVYLILSHSLEGNLGVRPDSDERWSLVAGQGNQSNDGALTVTHLGVVHRNRRAHGNSTAVSHAPPPKNGDGTNIVPAPPTRPGLGVHSVGGSLLEILRGGRHMKAQPANDVPTRTLKSHDVLIFYGIIYTLSLIIFLSFRMDAVKVNFSRLLRQVAMLYWRWSRLAPIIACSTLHVLADLLAVEAGIGNKNELCWKFALIATTAVYNNVYHQRFYEWIDANIVNGYIADGEGWLDKLKQVGMMQAAHLFLYLPLGVPFFILMADLINRAANDAVDHCATSALAGLPRHIVDSTGMAAQQLPFSYSASLIFWPASNYINFLVIQQWSPGFRSTWDAFMVVLWNGYVLSVKSDSPVAVGPMLTNRDAVVPDLKSQEASLDCNRFSLSAMLQSITEGFFWLVKTTYETLKSAFYKLYVFCMNTYHFIKTNLYLLGCYIKRKIWETWCIGCYIVRRVYILTWTLASFVCSISYRIFTIPFKIFESIKWYILMPFIPKLWDYESNPCPQANFDKSWTEVGVIWDGEPFGNMDTGKPIGG